MIAAIYARKSTEQTGVADEQKSVARQVDHARLYAVRKGWAVDEAHVYVDDGISGAEFANRPGFLRLMNALKLVATNIEGPYELIEGTKRSVMTHLASEPGTVRVCVGVGDRLPAWP